MGNPSERRAGRLRRKKAIRKKISGTRQRPRMSVFRSSKHIYVQVIDDRVGETLVSASTLETDLREECEEMAGKEAARFIGKKAAERCEEEDIEKVVFDRNGYIYHGRVKALADAAREAGLDF